MSYTLTVARPTRAPRKPTSFRLDPTVLAQAHAALDPLGLSVAALVERQILDFVRRNRTPGEVITAISRLPRQGAL